MTGILPQRNQHIRRRGFSAVEIIVTVAIIGVMAAMIMPGVINTKKYVKRRTDYIQWRDYLRVAAMSYEETLHLEQPLLVSLDFTSTAITYDEIRYYLGEMFYSGMMNGFPFPEMRYLETLNFADTRFDDSWTEWMLPAPALRNLILNETLITDASLDQIAGLSTEEFIYGRTQPMKKLKVLGLVACKNITDAAVERLQDALPDLKIFLTQKDMDSHDEDELYRKKERQDIDGSLNDTLKKIYDEGGGDEMSGEN